MMLMWIWFGISISLLLLEKMTNKKELISFLFSSILVLFLSRIIKKFLFQFLIFIILGSLIYIYNKKILKQMHKIYKKDMVGRIGKVYKSIKKDEIGLIKINKLKYKAISDTNIKVGTKVKITNVSKFILKVEKIK